jgi:hypothetical protein
MEPSRLHPAMDAGPRQTGGLKLSTRDDTVLPHRKRDDLEVWPVAFVPHRDTKATGTMISPLASGST